MNFKIVERPQLKVIFCLPGESFSHNFLMSWTELLQALPGQGITPIFSPAQSSVVYYVRNLCLCGDLRRGINQKPFNGQLPYDYIMWLDSDIVFKPEHFFRLLGHKKDIISGVYKMKGGQNFATVRKWDEGFFQKNGHFQFLTEQDLADESAPVEMDYTGLGFTLVKYGVFESFDYPWFQPLFYDIGACHDFSAEDVSFCKIAKQRGYKIYIDPRVRVGHEKSIVY